MERNATIFVFCSPVILPRLPRWGRALSATIVRRSVAAHIKDTLMLASIASGPRESPFHIYRISDLRGVGRRLDRFCSCFSPHCRPLQRRAPAQFLGRFFTPKGHL